MYHIMRGISHLIGVENQRSHELTCFSSMSHVKRTILDTKMVFSKVYNYLTKLIHVLNNLSTFEKNLWRDRF